MDLLQDLVDERGVRSVISFLGFLFRTCENSFLGFLFGTFLPIWNCASHLESRQLGSEERQIRCRYLYVFSYHRVPNQILGRSASSDFKVLDRDQWNNQEYDREEPESKVRGWVAAASESMITGEDSSWSIVQRIARSLSPISARSMRLAITISH